MTRVTLDFGDTMQRDAVPPVSADVIFPSSRFPNYKIGPNNQIMEVKQESKALTMKEVVARETAHLLEQQKRLSVRDLASKFEKGLAAAAKLSDEARMKDAASLEKHVLLKKLRDALEALRGRVAGKNKDDVKEAIAMVEALAVQLNQREGELIQEKTEVKKLATFLKQASEDAKKLVEEERAYARAEIENARAAVQRVEEALQEYEKMSGASGKQDMDELMKEVHEARRIKMLHQPSKVMDMEHELQALRVQLAEKCKYSIQLQKEAESSMNASALKRFVDENQRLAVECSNLLAQCKRWEKECALYDHDREALMDFGNEADERAKEAEIRVHDLEEEVRKLSEELHFYKCQYETQVDDTATDDASVEQNLLDNLLETVIGRDAAASTAHAFLEANSGVEVCQRLLTKWKRLRPSTQKVIALVAEVNTLQKEKEHLRTNLHKAEDEVNVLFDQNNVLDEANKRLIRLYQKEKHTPGSGGKPSSGKGNKRKSSPKISSPVEGKLDFSEVDSSRQPLSPLRENSPEYRLCKK